MIEEELIELVKTEKCLYNLKHPDYVNVKLKDGIWKQIAEELNLMDGNEAKKAWEKLRNNHRDALRRQSKPKSGQGTANIRPWRFQENMAFLIPHMANRYTPTSEEIQIDDTSQDARDNNIQENLSEEEETRTNEETNQSSGRISTVKVNRKWRAKRLNKMVEHQRVTKRQRVTERPTTNDFTVNNAKNDPLFHFFMSMYETTKRLPQLSQHTIKTSIFSSVSQEESKVLIQNSSRPHSGNAPGSYDVSDTPSPVHQQTSDSSPAETVPKIKQESLEIKAEGSSNMCVTYDEYTVDLVEMPCI